MEIKDIENLAELAKIDIPDQEKSDLVHEFSDILEYISIIQGAEVDDVIMHGDNYNAWRDDEFTERDFDRDSILNQFPDKQQDFLKVKKIL